MKIGMIGFGTVGKGVYQILQEEGGSLDQAIGQPLDLVKVASRHPDRLLAQGLPDQVVAPSPQDLVEDPEVEVLVELSSAHEAGASYIIRALELGKSVVTANKGAVALAYREMGEAARQAGVHFLFEAAVAGALPIIRTLLDRVPYNQFKSFKGIVNGSSNYVLTELAKERDREEVLAEARELGVLEADPTDDLKGYDALRKLVLAINLIRGTGDIKTQDIPCLGVDFLESQDLQAMAKQGKAVKLLASYQGLPGQDYRAMVLPQALDQKEALAQTDGVANLIEGKGSYIGEFSIGGKGGGMKPTADAVLSDLVQLGRGGRPSYPGLEEEEGKNLAFEEDHLFYVRQGQEASKEKLTLAEAQDLYGSGAGVIYLE